MEDNNENRTRVQRLLFGCVLQEWGCEWHYPANAGSTPGVDG